MGYIRTSETRSDFHEGIGKPSESPLKLSMQDIAIKSNRAPDEEKFQLQPRQIEFKDVQQTHNS